MKNNLLSIKEVWKTIPGYEGLYEVSNMGRVRKLSNGRHYKKGKILAFELCKGYYRIVLHNNGKRERCAVHRLVLEIFVGPCPEEMQASHLNDIKINNHLENLAWMTKSENIKLSFVNGRIHSCLGKHLSKKTKEKISAFQKINVKNHERNSRGQFIC